MARQSAASMATPALVRVPVLLTRPAAEAHAFAASLVRQFGRRVRPVSAPLMSVDYLVPALPAGPFAGVIFTSATGVEAALRLGRNLPTAAWCVGRKTADRAAAAGFSARSADGDAAALIAAICADPPGGRLLHLRGEETRGDVAQQLTSAGIETESAVVYRQLAQPFAPKGLALLHAAGPVILPLFSPRSAALFLAQVPKDLRATLWLVAISDAVATTARAIPHHALTQAARPDAEAMLEAIGRTLDRVCTP